MRDRISSAQLQRIAEVASDMNKRKDLLVAGIKHLNPRLKALEDNKLYIEELILCAQALEHIIRYVIRAYRTKTAVETILGILPPNSDLSDLRDNLTLNDLIKILESSMPFDQEGLIPRLKDFNKNYRVQFVHKIFDGNNDIEEINERAGRYLHSDNKFDQLIDELYKLEEEAQARTNSLY